MTESQQPNPFSREGSTPSDGLSSDNAPEQTTPYQSPPDESTSQYASNWPSYPASDPYENPPTDPYGRPVGSYGSASTDPAYGVPGPSFDTQATPRYDPIQGYENPPSYGNPYEANRYEANPYEANRYEANPYEANPYQPRFGGVSPYTTGSTEPTVPHPQAALALVLGILGTVLGVGCIVGGLVGIGGIVLGRRVKNDIDADPGRYSGRSQAIAGMITGIVGVSITVLATIFIVLAIVAGIASTNY
jgi:hypothetical protein